MGLFNNPPSRVVSEEEFEKVLSAVSRKHRGVPHEEFQKIRAMAAGYLNEHGQFRGMDEKELKQFLGNVTPVIDRSYRGMLKTLDVELQKALGGRYGSFL
ncbi:MAG: hypothetical protein Q7S09_04670 [bacterium]|nr:hypothetical protein [bacterium]